MKTKIIVSIAAATAVMTIIAGLIVTNRVSAFTLTESNWNLGVVGVTPAETIRLNVASLGGSGSCPSDPSRVELSFVGANGGILLPAVQKTIGPGHSAFVELNGAEITSSELGRIEIRPIATIMSGRGGVDSCSVVTVEVIDNFTHKTTLVYDGFRPRSER